MPVKEFQEWPCKLIWELDHEKGIARATFESGDMKRSVRFVQGFWFDENNKMADPETVAAICHLLKLVTKN